MHPNYKPRKIFVIDLHTRYTSCTIASMEIKAHRPQVKAIDTFNAGKPFHTIELLDHTGGTLTLFIDENWTVWDNIVAAVNNYRDQRWNAEIDAFREQAH